VMSPESVSSQSVLSVETEKRMSEFNPYQQHHLFGLTLFPDFRISFSHE
jgi:hypothetical protein